MKTIIYCVVALFAVTGCVAQNSIKEGDHLPVFSLPDKDGVVFNSLDVVGKQNLVIYFYPKDDTPGCTKEACTFRDQYNAFKDANALVVGISGQSAESHKAFVEKYHLPFLLLCDEGDVVRKLFGVPSSALGMLPGRVTYVVNKQGVVVLVFNSLTNAEGHVSEALKALNQIKQ